MRWSKHACKKKKKQKNSKEHKVVVGKGCAACQIAQSHWTQLWGTKWTLKLNEKEKYKTQTRKHNFKAGGTKRATTEKCAFSTKV